MGWPERHAVGPDGRFRGIFAAVLPFRAFRETGDQRVNHWFPSSPVRDRCAEQDVGAEKAFDRLPEQRQHLFRGPSDPVDDCLQVLTAHRVSLGITADLVIRAVEIVVALPVGLIGLGVLARMRQSRANQLS